MASVGIKWHSSDPSPILTRVASASSPSGWATMSQDQATAALDTISPWAYMGRVSVRPDGSAASRCNIGTNTAALNGDLCYSDTDDSSGEQKMVYLKKFCYAIDTLTTDYVTFWIGDVGDMIPVSTGGTYTLTDTGTGFQITTGVTTGDVWPSFVVDGIIKDGVYIGAYGGYYNTNFMDAGTTALESKVGVVPTAMTTPLTIANARIAAQNIGTGWHLTTLQVYNAVALMAFMEYKSWSLGAPLGAGNILSIAPLNTGMTTTYGNKSYGTSEFANLPMSYRGVENFYGNLAQFAEGINLRTDGNPWIAPQSNATGYYACGKFTGGYADTGHVVPVEGYVSAMYPDWAFIPSAADAADMSHYLCSYSFGQVTVDSACFYGGSYHTEGTGLGYYPIGYLGSACSTPLVFNGFRICHLPP